LGPLACEPVSFKRRRRCLETILVKLSVQPIYAIPVVFKPESAPGLGTLFEQRPYGYLYEQCPSSVTFSFYVDMKFDGAEYITCGTCAIASYGGTALLETLNSAFGAGHALIESPDSAFIEAAIDQECRGYHRRVEGD